MATMHIDEIKIMARKAHEDAAFREGLFATMMDGDREEAVHAAWALTHLPKTDNDFIAAHREVLVGLATMTTDVSLRRITLALLERCEWSLEALNIEEDDVPDYYVALLDFSMVNMMMGEEPYGVRSLCMKLAYKLSLPYPELLDELRQNLMMIESDELGSGVKNTYYKILKLL